MGLSEHMGKEKDFYPSCQASKRAELKIRCHQDSPSLPAPHGRGGHTRDEAFVLGSAQGSSFCLLLQKC